MIGPPLPSDFLVSLESAPGIQMESFKRVHESREQVVSVRFNPLKTSSELLPINIGGSTIKRQDRVPWSSLGYYLEERPQFTFDPLFHAGVYYVQEASSMFLDEAFRQTNDCSKRLRVLDLCAAPGGKSTLLQSMLTADSLLVSNEVIKSRLPSLLENLTKWGGSNAIVSSSDPSIFSKLENFFDCILIDAPCSGSGLFRRDPEAINEWSLDQVRTCSLRQQRIISDAWPCLKEGGVLIYSTCSYSNEENELVLDRLFANHAAESISLRLKEEWNIVESISPQHKAFGYRFYPDRLKGEGFFISCLRKLDGGSFNLSKSIRAGLESLKKTELEMVKPYLCQDISFSFLKHEDHVFAMPQALVSDLLYLQKYLYLKKSGITLGKLSAKELIPHHELALSTIANPGLRSINLSNEDALHYLRKEDFKVEEINKGWMLVNYKTANLGWIKNLGNRINNYYPMEWRILKRN
jgi:16S rRNA C967 or C1407 C5-methylase (RsmB/RsmF family)/NOL1/NOP2/fmu family ribosome biogenesis protein